MSKNIKIEILYNAILFMIINYKILYNISNFWIFILIYLIEKYFSSINLFYKLLLMILVFYYIIIESLIL